MEKPRVVAEVSVGHCWFPDLLKFSAGELMLNHSLNSDANINGHNSQAVYLSRDGGRSWDFGYDVNGFHNSGGECRLSLPDGRIVGVSTFLKPSPPGQFRRFVAHHWTYDCGGRRYAVEPWGVTVEGLPRNVEPWPDPSRTWWARINWFSDIVVLDDGQWLSTLSLRYQGDKRESTVALISEEGGRGWRYLSTIAGPDDVPDAIEGFDEPCLLRLEDGDVMCVSRVGGGQDQKLARTYSHDGGKTWSSIDRLPAWGVAPQMCRLQNGMLALSTGWPGIFVWFSTDSRGRKWQSFDVQQYHNSVADAAGAIRVVKEGLGEPTTAYTAMVEATPNRVLLVYDRIPFSWQPTPAGAGQRSQIYLLEFDVDGR